MKRCIACGHHKPLQDFNRNRSRKDGKQSRCRECDRTRARDNSRRYNEQFYARRIKYRERNYRYLNDYLISHPCLDCGEMDPVVLDFDHVRGKKRDNVTTLANNSCSINVLEIEIAKCEIRCANCHRKVTRLRSSYGRASA